jgi:uncharacterized protein
MTGVNVGRTVIIFAATILSLTLYVLMHISVGIYLKHAFPNWQFGMLLAILGTASILCFILAKLKRHMFTTWFYRIGSLWMGVIVIAFTILFPLDIASVLLGKQVYPLLPLLLIALLILWALYLAFTPYVKRITLRIKHLPKEMKLVQITDLHIGEIYTPQWLQTIVDKVNALEPDIVAVTGDVFDGGGKMYPHMIDALHNIKAKHVLFVRGNHEVYEGVYITTRLIKAEGLTVLDDQVKVIDGVQFVGLSYPTDFSDDKKETLAKLVNKLDKRKPIILLRHEPAGIDDAAKLGVHLQLSGHTHNGQMWPLNYLVLLFYKHAKGLHRIGDFVVYISPGTGTWGPPLRLGSQSEITEFTLKKA